jgi:uridine kinase
MNLSGMIIGIGGASRSGKTLLANSISATLGHERTSIISQDDYVHPEQSIPHIKNFPDWESPLSIDFERLLKDVKSASKQHDYVIIEGFLSFYNSDVVQCFDRSIYVVIDKDIFTHRRLLDQRWAKEPDWYLEHIWSSYLRYGKLPEIHNALILNGNSTHSIEDILDNLGVYR